MKISILMKLSKRKKIIAFSICLFLIIVALILFFFTASPLSKLNPDDYSDNPLLMKFVEDIQASRELNAFELEKIGDRFFAIAEMDDPRFIDVCLAILSEKPRIKLGLKEKLYALASYARGTISIKSLKKIWNNQEDYSMRFRKVHAAWILGEIRSKRAVPELISLLESSGNSVDTASTYALGKIGGDDVLQPLIDQLNKENVAAATALGDLGDPRAVDALIKLVQENNCYSYLAIRALRRIGDTRAIESLIKVLEKCPDKYLAPYSPTSFKSSSIETSAINTAFAAEALGEIGDDRAIKALEQIMAKNNLYWVRFHAKEALDKLKRKSVCLDDIEGFHPSVKSRNGKFYIYYHCCPTVEIFGNHI